MRGKKRKLQKLKHVVLCALTACTLRLEGLPIRPPDARLPDAPLIDGGPSRDGSRDARKDRSFDRVMERAEYRDAGMDAVEDRQDEVIEDGGGGEGGFESGMEDGGAGSILFLPPPDAAVGFLRGKICDHVDIGTYLVGDVDSVRPFAVGFCDIMEARLASHPAFMGEIHVCDTSVSTGVRFEALGVVEHEGEEYLAMRLKCVSTDEVLGTVACRTSARLEDCPGEFGPGACMLKLRAGYLDEEGRRVMCSDITFFICAYSTFSDPPLFSASLYGEYSSWTIGVDCESWP